MAAVTERNYFELQIDNFGDWDVSSEWMNRSQISHTAPSVRSSILRRSLWPVPPGASFEEIRRRVWGSDELRPDVFPDRRRSWAIRRYRSSGELRGLLELVGQPRVAVAAVETPCGSAGSGAGLDAV